MKSGFGIIAAVAAFPLVAGSMAIACASSDDDRPSQTGIQTCDHPGCPGWGSDAGESADATGDQQGDVDKWDGPRHNVQGRLWKVQPPWFDPLANDQPPLLNPARIRVYAHDVDYVATYGGPDAGFELLNIPEGTYAIQIEDVQEQNDMLTTIWNVVIPPNTGSLPEPITPKKAIEDILASVSPPVTLDPTKAHLLITILSAGYSGVSGLHMGPPHTAEAILYDSEDGAEGKWVRDQASGTGPHGMAIIANMDCPSYPGETFVLKYSKANASGGTEDPITIAAGAMTRVYQIEAWAER